MFFFTFTFLSLCQQPYPPPRGCILVQKKSLCCPYLSCSKYHVNFYKNTERNREHENNYHHQITHEKIVEKNYRTDDAEEEMINGGMRENVNINIRRIFSTHKNKFSFQVALKVEVFTHQVICHNWCEFFLFSFHFLPFSFHFHSFFYSHA